MFTPVDDSEVTVMYAVSKLSPCMHCIFVISQIAIYLSQHNNYLP